MEVIRALYFFFIFVAGVAGIIWGGGTLSHGVVLLLTQGFVASAEFITLGVVVFLFGIVAKYASVTA